MAAKWFGLALALLALGATPAPPTSSIQVTFDARSPDLDLNEIEVVASAEGSDQIVEPKSRDGNTLSFELAANRSWAITCRGESFWCPEVSIGNRSGEPLAEPLTTRLQLPVARRVSLQAKLVASRGELPMSVKLQGWETQQHPTAPLELELEAVVNNGRAHFQLPDVPLDLRVAAAGFAPIYAWGLKPSTRPKAADGTHALGTWTLRPGSSLCGFVTDGATGDPVEGAEVLVRLPRHRPGTPSQTARRLERMTWKTESNERGFFQVVGPPAGVYRLEVKPGDAERLPRILPAVELADQSETCIEHLELQEAVPLHILLEAPNIVAGKNPWQIRLTPRSAGGHVSPEDAQAPNPEGIASFRVAPGDYSLKVRSLNPPLLALSRQITVQSEQTIPIELDVLPVEGHVFLGETPLVAAIELNVDDGGLVKLESDGEGQFRGWTRRPENSLVAHVKAVHPEFSRYVVLDDVHMEDGVLRLALDFPDRRMTGTVQDETGRPVRSARVTARPESSRLVVSTKSGVDGRFELVGLEDRPLVLSAKAREVGDSEPVRVQPWSEGVNPDFTLVLKRGRKLEGRVSTDLGEPVAAARVHILTIGERSASAHDTTAISGAFEVQVPETATRAIVKVFSSRINWSACLPLPGEGQAMEIRLPSTFGGSVYLPHDTSKGPFSQRTLLNSDGGFFTVTDLINFGNARQVEGGYIASSMARGAYALFTSEEIIPRFSTRVCDRALPVETWRPLVERQALRFDLDR